MIKNKYFVLLFSFFICTKNTLKYYSTYKNIHTIFLFYKFLLFDILKNPDVIQKNGSDIWNHRMLNVHNPLFNQKIQKKIFFCCSVIIIISYDNYYNTSSDFKGISLNVIPFQFHIAFIQINEALILKYGLKFCFIEF